MAEPAVSGIDGEHPWPWLEAFPETAAERFHGRGDDVEALLQAVTSGPVTVLFGRSGLGKTSLLQAGLFPRLAERRLFPVLLRRVDHGPGGADLSARWLARLEAESQARGLHWQGPADAADDGRARLWERLHRRGGAWHDAAGQRWTPLLALDQFEEVFTLQSDPAARRRLFEELGDLLENRIPPPVAARIDADESLLDALDLDAQPYRCLVSLREDFLAELEEWAGLLPRLATQRLRLLPMNGEQALAAVQRTGGALVDEASARRIVEFLGAQGQRRAGIAAAQVEPALLSLVCASLNEERLARGAARLDVGDLEQQGSRILDRFYDQAFAALPEPLREPARAWVESELITAGGTRRPYPRRDLRPPLDAALEPLVQRRLLRVENAETGDFVELVHDRLAAVARERARVARERAERAAADAEAAAAAARRRRRWRWAAGLGGGVLAVALVGLVVVFNLYRQAEAAQAQAQAALAKAREATRASTALRLVGDATALADGSREGPLPRALWSALAGHRLAQDGAARAAAYGALQQAADSLLVKVRHGPDGPLVALTPDHRLAVVSNGNAPAIVEVDTGRTLHWLPLRGSDEVTALAVSPDGGLIATGQQSGQVRTWRVSDGNGQSTVGKTPGAVVALGFGPGGHSLVAVGRQGIVRWDPVSGRPLAQLSLPPSFDGWPVGAAFAADGRLLAVLTETGRLVVRDAQTLRERWRHDPGDSFDPVEQAAFLSGGKTLATATGRAMLHTWDAASGRRIHPGQRESDRVQRLAASPDGRVLVLAGVDGRLRWRDAGSLLPLRPPVKAHGAGARWSPGFVAHGNAVLTVGDDGLWTLWRTDLEPQGQRLLLPEGVESLAGLQFDADGRRLHVVSAPGRRSTLGIADGAPVSSVELRWPGDTNVWASMAPGAGPIALRDTERLALYDAASGRLLKSAPHEVDTYPLPLSFNADGQRLAVGSSAGRLAWLSVPGLEPTGPPLALFDDSDAVTSIATAASGAAWAAGSQQGYLAQSRSGGVAPAVNRLGSEPISALAFGGAQLAVGLGRHILITPADPAQRPQDGRRLSGHGTPVSTMAFSTDGRRLVSGSWDGTLRLWDTAAPAPVGQPLRGHSGWPQAVAFAPDGRSVASAGSDGSLRLWPVFDAWVDAVCAKLDRNPSRAEWREWVAPDIDYVTLCPALPVPVGN